MTYAEYVAFDEASDVKHEYVNGLMYAMAGGTPEHARLSGRFMTLLGGVLGGKPCAVFSSDLRIRIEATGRATYPDVSVVCDEKRLAADDDHAITNPTVLVEVLSPTTEADDRGDKFSHYRRLESLREYVLVSQETPRVEVFRRDGDVWVLRDYGPGQRVELASLDVSFAVDELYRDPLTPPQP